MRVKGVIKSYIRHVNLSVVFIILIIVLNLALIFRSTDNDSFLFTDIVSNHDVVDCEGPTLKNHCYWPIVSDFINVLSHKTIAEMFMQNRDLIKQWLKFIGHLTG